MDKKKIEDAVFKKAMEFFKESALDFFGISTNIKILDSAETEIKNIDIKTNHADYLFHTSDGNYLHFEFQTTNKKEDLRRFLYYDASLHYKEGKNLKTVVIYSADIEQVETTIDAGSIKYSIDAFYMKSLDGDEKLNYLNEKILKRKSLNKNDIMSLTFIPLMKSKKSRSDMTLESVELANKIQDPHEKTQCISLLYALFEKFGDDKTKNRFKEVISMTEIGRMIKEEGISEGIAKGTAMGKSDILIKLLIKKFKSLPSNYKEKIRLLDEDTLDILATDIFDIESLKDLDKYLNI